MSLYRAQDKGACICMFLGPADKGISYEEAKRDR